MPTPVTPSRRYSSDALILHANSLFPSFQARADRNPKWLTAETLKVFDRAVLNAAGKLARAETRSFPDKRTIRKYQAELFYSTAQRNAFRMVLYNTDPRLEPAPSLAPARPKPGTKLPAGLAENLSSARMRLKYQRRTEEALVAEYEKLLVQRDAAWAEDTRIRDELRATVKDAEALREKLWLNRNPDAQRVLLPRGMTPGIRQRERALREHRKSIKPLVHETDMTWRKLTRCREMIKYLHEYVRDMHQKYYTSTSNEIDNAPITTPPPAPEPYDPDEAVNWGL